MSHRSRVVSFSAFPLIPVLAVCALTARGANAQSTSEAPQESVRPGWTFVPSMTFATAYDDNVLLVGVAPGTPFAEEKPSDVVTSLLPGGALDYFGPRLQFSSGYQGAFSMYRDLGELDSVDQHARARLQYRATRRLTIFAGQSFSTARTTDTVELVGIPFRRIGNWTTLTQGALEYRLTARTTTKGGYDLRVVNFDDNADQFLSFPGGHEHHFTGTIDHRFTQRFTFGGAYDLRRVVVVGDEAIVLVHHSAATAEFRPNEPLTIFGSIGFTHLGGDVPTLDKNGTAYSVGLRGRFEHFDLTSAYHRSVLPSFGFGGTFQNEEFGATIRAPFAKRRGYVQGSFAWRMNDPLIPGPPGTESTWYTSLLGYAVRPWIRLEGYYSRAHQNTQRAGGIVDRNRVGFQIVTSKRMALPR
jgi:hypothetical protein